MKLFPLILLILLISCKSDIKYPAGGYPYPSDYLAQDTNLYYYLLKNIESKKEALADFYMYKFYQLFKEPNLSLKPNKNETFRLAFRDAFYNDIVFTLEENLITVKKGNTDSLYSKSNQLTSLEKEHLEILKQYYPIEEMDKDSKFKKRTDSLAKVYPQLSDVKYYHRIYEKSFVRTEKKFTFETSRFRITTEKYDSLLNQLNESGFWTLPYFNEAKKGMLDGFVFTLEANTHKKYKVVTVQTCANNVDKFTKFCQELINLTGLGKEINLVCGEK